LKFENKPSNINEVFNLINLAHCGQQVLVHFNHFYREKVKLEPYPIELLTRLRKEIRADQATGACFVHDGSNGTIYYDPNTSIGILGPFILHELVHATDLELWKLPHLPKDSPLRQSILMETEIRAFQTQQKFIAEIKQIYPSYSLFIDQVKARMRILAEDLNIEEIQTLYNFKH
jgi:hypothetical protein